MGRSTREALERYVDDLHCAGHLTCTTCKSIKLCYCLFPATY